MKAMIIEPSKTYRLLLKELLNGYSIISDEIEKGDLALSKLNDENYEVVFVAMHLPDMSGTEFSKKLKAQDKFKNTIILLLTSEQDEGNWLQ